MRMKIRGIEKRKDTFNCPKREEKKEMNYW
jgi:hypothetical protein